MPSPQNKSPKKRPRFNWITFDFMLSGSIAAIVTAACLMMALPVALALGAGPIGGILVGAAVVGALFGYVLKRCLMQSKKKPQKNKEPIELNDVLESPAKIYSDLNVSPTVTLTAEPDQAALVSANETKSNAPENEMSIVSRSDAELQLEVEFNRSHAPSRRDDAY